jgi:cytochrome c-type biogenesis protein CcmE
MEVNSQTSEHPAARRRTPWLNPKLLVVAVVIALAVGFLIFNAMGASGAYYMTVSELAERGSEVQQERIKVGGDVLPGSIERGGIGEELRFEVTDGVASIPVVYHEVPPDIFSEDVEVIVTGTLGPDGVIRAEEVLTKCPSRFESDEGVSS